MGKSDSPHSLDRFLKRFLHRDTVPSLGSMRSKTAGPNKTPDDELAHDRGHPQRAQGDRDQPDARQQDQQIEGDVMHAANLAQGAHRPLEDLPRIFARARTRIRRF